MRNPAIIHDDPSGSNRVKKKQNRARMHEDAAFLKVRRVPLLAYICIDGLIV